MSRPRIYIGGPFATAIYIRNVQANFTARGFETHISWLLDAHGGKEDLLSMPEEECDRRLRLNTVELSHSDVALFIDLEGTGHEMYCELARAVDMKKPTFFAGYSSLTARSSYVSYFTQPSDAINATLRFVADKLDVR